MQQKMRNACEYQMFVYIQYINWTTGIYCAWNEKYDHMFYNWSSTLSTFTLTLLNKKLTY